MSCKHAGSIKSWWDKTCHVVRCLFWTSNRANYAFLLIGMQNIFSGQNIMRLSFIYLCIVIQKWLSLIYSKAAGDATHAMMFIFPSREVNKTSTTGLLITGHQEKRIIGLIVHLCFSRRLKSDKALKHKIKSCFLYISWWQCNAITVLPQGNTNQGRF